MKLLQAISQENLQVINLPRAIKIAPDAFGQMWSKNDATRRISNPQLIEKIGNNWQQHLGNADVEIAEVFIDKTHLQYLDLDTKQLQAMTDTDLLDLDVSRLVAGRCIVKLKATGFDTEISPSLAVHITERGEQFSFGDLVHVCSNFTVLNADYFFDTQKIISKLQKGKKWDLQDVLQFFDKSILPNTALNFDLDMQLIEELKAKTVQKGDFNRFVGELFGKIDVGKAPLLGSLIVAGYENWCFS